MSLTAIQRRICRLIAEQRRRSGESYVAGGAALNELIGAARRSRDVDLFHDSDAALDASWDLDSKLLRDAGFDLEIRRQRAGLIEAVASADGESVILEWARDSAFRFFPLVEHVDFGLTLHPFDLATNKVLALVGRLEVRDWVDVIECDRRVQPLGYLAWAASGKDPGFSPASILAEAGRTARYSAEEVASLDFGGPPPDAADLSRQWHRILDQAVNVIAALPAAEAGQCVLTARGDLYRGSNDEVSAAVRAGALHYHRGSIRGVLPELSRQS